MSSRWANSISQGGPPRKRLGISYKKKKKIGYPAIRCSLQRYFFRRESVRNWSRFLSVLAMGSVVSLAMSEQADAASAGLPKGPVTELVTIDRSVGQGGEARAGQQVSVHYTGWLFDPSKADGKGKKFDSSVDRGQPFSFPLGAGRVIAGWDKGFAGMKVGGKRTLVIPSDMGYGARGAGGVIPPNATLMFDVELLGVR
jgi:FKBP-type peptidyl-prolyl cis-trans isomerase FkpA